VRCYHRPLYFRLESRPSIATTVRHAETGKRVIVPTADRDTYWHNRQARQQHFAITSGVVSSFSFLRSVASA